MHLLNSFNKRSLEGLFMLDFGNSPHNYLWLVCNADIIANHIQRYIFRMHAYKTDI